MVDSEKTVGKFGLVGFVLGATGGAILALAYMFPYWYHLADVNIGIFRVCGETCRPLEFKDKYPLEMFVMRYILLWSLITTLMGLVPGLISVATCSKRHPMKMTGVFFISTGITCCAGVGTFTGMSLARKTLCLESLFCVADDTSWLSIWGASYYICWACVPTFIIAGVLCVVEKSHWNQKVPVTKYRASIQPHQNGHAFDDIRFPGY